MKYSLKQLLDHCVAFKKNECKGKDIWSKIPEIEIARFWSNKLNLWLDFYSLYSTLTGNIYFITYCDYEGYRYLYKDNKFHLSIPKTEKGMPDFNTINLGSWDNILDYGIDNFDIDLDSPVTNKKRHFQQLIALKK